MKKAVISDAKIPLPWLLHFDSLFITEFVKQIDVINLFCYITHQKVYIILSDLQTAMTEKSGEGYHVATV